MAREKGKRRSTQALLLVDFINLFDFERAGSLGPRAVRAARNAARLKSGLRAKGVPCIYANDNFGHWHSEFSALVATCTARSGPSRTIATLLAPEKRDLSVLKPRHSAFFGTPLEFLLDELGVSALVVAGIALDRCVVATAQDAFVRKYSISVPSDCSAGFSGAEESEALSLMARTMRVDTRPSRR